MRQTLFALFAWVSLTLMAQTREVSGTYVYYADPSQSPKEAKAAAIQQAKMKTLAREFGTLLVQSTLQQDELKNGKENNYFKQLSSAEVKGEWLSDTKTPIVRRTDITDDDVMVYEATVWGKVRPISNEASEFEVLALRNGTSKRHADTRFVEGDDLYLYFKAPVDGYVAVYLTDDAGRVNCLLPYPDDGDGKHPVKHGKEYVFFSTDMADEATRNITESCYLTCDDPLVESDQLYVLFSPNEFTKAVDEQVHADDRRLAPQLSQEKFARWMGKLCARDKKMGRKIIRITVNKK